MVLKVVLRIITFFILDHKSDEERSRTFFLVSLISWSGTTTFPTKEIYYRLTCIGYLVTFVSLMEYIVRVSPLKGPRTSTTILGFYFDFVTNRGMRFLLPEFGDLEGPSRSILRRLDR